MNEPTTQVSSATAQNKTSLLKILEKVSRSFYLTIRVLPINLRQPVSVAYLLARAADSITDTGLFQQEKRPFFLKQLRKQLDTTACKDKLKSLVPKPNPDSTPLFSNEIELLESLPEIFSLYESLPTQDKAMVKNVVLTLIEGMEYDLTVFTKSPGTINSLKNAEDLDRYIYLVAGCVGDFWTRISIAHCLELRHWPLDTYVKLGINYGKALQLTNVLRDIPQDLRMGRCYLPLNQLMKNHLSVEQLLDLQMEPRVRPLLLQWLETTLALYADGEKYCLGIPKTCVRLRIASLWPLSIGLATLLKMVQNPNWLDPSHPSKVKRRWIYGLILCSPIIVSSNTVMQWWLRKQRKKIHQAIDKY